MTRIMGVLNVTPDSFSDAGRYRREGDAVDRGVAMAAAGAEIVDVGGESTRPGARPVDPTTERRRVLGVVERLTRRGVRVSIDTLHADTAVAAAARGAEFVNDVSGGLADPAMAGAVARTGLTYIIGHWRGDPRTMNGLAEYRDPAGEVLRELEARILSARRAGVDESRIVLDPGLGFAKRPEHNWALLTELPRLLELGFPVMIGASRKRFLGELVPDSGSLAGRDLPTAVISVLCAQRNVWAVRVHDVAGSRVALDTLAAWNAASALLLR
ncbi:dihydropteroate synthase [Streptomyces sp. NPDC056716]|uniref:dihydropteroate synthase n=1 Tax=unclassified Streptomyces TaxID=2593676 RepID=UPI0036C525FD